MLRRRTFLLAADTLAASTSAASAQSQTSDLNGALFGAREGAVCASISPIEPAVIDIAPATGRAAVAGGGV